MLRLSGRERLIPQPREPKHSPLPLHSSFTPPFSIRSPTGEPLRNPARLQGLVCGRVNSGGLGGRCCGTLCCDRVAWLTGGIPQLTGSPEAHPEACEQMWPCLPLCLQLSVAAHSCLSGSEVRGSSHLSVCHSCWELSSDLPLPREQERTLRVRVLSGVTRLQVAIFSPVPPFSQLHLRCSL